jgi:SOS-response transcriptional repressor LexA
MLTDSHIRAIGMAIKRRRMEKGLTARQLAEMVGISDAHIIYIEKAQRKATFDKIVNILDVLGSSAEEVLAEICYSAIDGEATLTPGTHRIPVVTWVTAGKWREVCDAFEPGSADEWINSDVKGRNVFALRVAGDSMEPEFKDSEIIIVNPHVEGQPNDFVVVKNREGEATFKQLKRYGSNWVLHPLNLKYPDQVVRRGEFSIIGKVVKKEKRY